jgi:hypothetical protein
MHLHDGHEYLGPFNPSDRIITFKESVSTHHVVFGVGSGHSRTRSLWEGQDSGVGVYETIDGPRNEETSKRESRKRSVLSASAIERNAITYLFKFQKSKPFTIEALNSSPKPFSTLKFEATRFPIKM